MKNQRLWLILIVLAYVTLGITFALATPPLEASDEYKHYPFVQYVQTQGKLPVLDPDDPGLWLQEAAQPPLYYLGMAGLTAWIDTGDLAAVHHKNPHAFIGNPDQITNKNLIIHRPEREKFPWSGAVLAVYVIRLASIGLGAGTVLLTARLGRALFNPPLGLLAAALTAFNPMFLFVSAAVNNDSLAILLGHLGLYLLLRLWQDAPDPRRQWRRYAALGVVLGLGLLTKLSLGGLLALTGLALLCLAWRRRKWQFLLLGGAIVLSTTLLLSGWWFLRNLKLYGDLTGLGAFITVQGTRDVPLGWQGWLGEFGTLYRSYWGLFGGVNVAAPKFFYTVCNSLALLGALGLIIWLWRKRSGTPGGLWLLPIWAGTLLALLLRWNIISPAFQGRLLFPALGALNLLWALGLLAWMPRSWRWQAASALAGAMLIAAAALPWVAIRPAYAYPAPLDAVPDAAQFGPIAFEAGDGQINLVGVEMPPHQSVTPGGDPIKVVLYWQAVSTVERDYLSAVHLLGREYRSVGQVNRYPAWGMIPTGRWQAGQIWRDLYHVYVDAEAAAPSRLLVSVGLYDSLASRTLPASGPDGTAMGMVIVGGAKLAAPEEQSIEVPNPLRYTVGGTAALIGYEIEPAAVAPGASLHVTLYWEAVAAPPEDYTVFVQLLDESGTLRGQGDSPPLKGDYPTSLWEPGEIIIDEHLITVNDDAPPGRYRLAVGLYRPADGSRLPVSDADGASQPGDWIVLPLKVQRTYTE